MAERGHVPVDGSATEGPTAGILSDASERPTVPWRHAAPPVPPPSARAEGARQDAVAFAVVALLHERDTLMASLEIRSSADFRALPVGCVERRAEFANLQAGSDDLRASLLTVLAPLLSPRLERLLGHLRRRMGRSRELVPLSRVRELDPTCIRRNVHLPGRTLMEKAGPRQRLLAVVRRERFDTMENRFLRRFCHQLLRQLEPTLANIGRRPGTAGSSRGQSLRRLRKAGGALLASAELAAVGAPRPGARPSHALMRDADYRAAWRMGRLLRQRERDFAPAWRAADGAWCELVLIALVQALDGAAAAEPCPSWHRVALCVNGDGQRLSTSGPLTWMCVDEERLIRLRVIACSASNLRVVRQSWGPDAVTVQQEHEIEVKLALESHGARYDSELTSEQRERVATAGQGTASANRLHASVDIDGIERRVTLDRRGAEMAAQAVLALLLPDNLRSRRHSSAKDGQQASSGSLAVSLLDRRAWTCPRPDVSPGPPPQPRAGALVAESTMPVDGEPAFVFRGRVATWGDDVHGPGTLWSDKLDLCAELHLHFDGLAALVIPDATAAWQLAKLRRRVGRVWAVWSPVAAALTAAQSRSDLFAPPLADAPIGVAVICDTDAALDVAVLEYRHEVRPDGVDDAVFIRSQPRVALAGRQARADLTGHGAAAAWLRAGWSASSWQMNGDEYSSIRTNTEPATPIAEVDSTLRAWQGVVPTIAVLIGCHGREVAQLLRDRAMTVIELPDSALATGAAIFLARHRQGQPTWRDRLARVDLVARVGRKRERVAIIDPARRLVAPGEQLDYTSSEVFAVPSAEPRVTFPLCVEGLDSASEVVLEGPPLPLKVPVEVKVRVRFEYGRDGISGVLAPVAAAPFADIAFRIDSASAAGQIPGATRTAAPPWRSAGGPDHYQRERLIAAANAVHELASVLSSRGHGGKRGKDRNENKQNSALHLALKDLQQACLPLESHVDDGFDAALQRHISATAADDLDWLLGLLQRKGRRAPPKLSRNEEELVVRVRARLLVDEDGRFGLALAGTNFEHLPVQARLQALQRVARLPDTPAWQKLRTFEVERQHDADMWARALCWALRAHPEAAPALGDDAGVLLNEAVMLLEQWVAVPNTKKLLYALFELVTALCFARQSDHIQIDDPLVQDCAKRLAAVREHMSDEQRAYGEHSATHSEDEPGAVALAYLRGDYHVLAARRVT